MTKLLILKYLSHVIERINVNFQAAVMQCICRTSVQYMYVCHATNIHLTINDGINVHTKYKFPFQAGRPHQGH